MSNQRRAEIIELLRAHPNGMATLPIAKQLGFITEGRAHRGGH